MADEKVSAQAHILSACVCVCRFSAFKYKIYKIFTSICICLCLIQVMIVKCKLGLAVLLYLHMFHQRIEGRRKPSSLSAIPAKQSTKENVALKIQARGIVIYHPLCEVCGHVGWRRGERNGLRKGSGDVPYLARRYIIHIYTAFGSSWQRLIYNLGQNKWKT